MAIWKQRNDDGAVVKSVNGRACGLFGVVKSTRTRYGTWQVDHLPSGFVVARVPGWDHKMHLRLASALNRLVSARYPDEASNPWLFQSKPPREVLARMKVDVSEAKLEAML